MYTFKTPAAFDAAKSMADRAAAIMRLEKYHDAMAAVTRPGMLAWEAAVTNSPVRALTEGGGTLAVKGVCHG
jgi:hypothetical protein